MIALLRQRFDHFLRDWAPLAPEGDRVVGPKRSGLVNQAADVHHRRCPPQQSRRVCFALLSALFTDSSTSSGHQRTEGREPAGGEKFEEQLLGQEGFARSVLRQSSALQSDYHHRTERGPISSPLGTTGSAQCSYLAKEEEKDDWEHR